MRNIAEKVFIQLNQAYKKNDVVEVQRILSELKQGTFKPRSETVSKADQLKVIIRILKHQIVKFEQEIFAIKDSEDYQTISGISDWNVYFRDIKIQLIEETSYLEAYM